MLVLVLLLLLLWVVWAAHLAINPSVVLLVEANPVIRDSQERCSLECLPAPLLQSWELSVRV
jgi:hypothetical protein